jgi:hypothetical protein
MADLTRHGHAKIEPERAIDLSASNDAAINGHTTFRKTVVGPFESQRFLIAGENSSKVGKMVTKGPWAGMPIFTLTLEERATCPRACPMWLGCYGNAMPMTRRNDALHPDFMPALKAEVITLVREVCATNPLNVRRIPPRGLVIRLHVLGDFFSVSYVRMWARLMEYLPELHVFGYTARANGLEDPKNAAIASAILALNERFPDRWVIRWSADTPGAGRAIVVDEDPHLPDVLVCPAQTDKSETCGTCGLCWSPGFKGKTIAFLKHGMKSMAGRSAPRDELGFTPNERRVYEFMRTGAEPSGLVLHASLKNTCRTLGMTVGPVQNAFRKLLESRRVQLVRQGSGRIGSVYRVFDEPQAIFPKAPPIPLPARAAKPVTIAERPVGLGAQPVVRRGPDDPLMMRPPPKKRVGWGAQQIGTADQFDIGTAEERIEALPETEKERIARQYGAQFTPKKEP